MIFIDANIFGHAYMKPRRELTPAEAQMKGSAKQIIRSLEEGEEMASTTVHISEVLNILEDNLGVKQSMAFLAWIIAAKNLTVFPVGVTEYESALNIARESNIGLNDSLAVHIMRREGIGEIYSMDRHFDGLKDVLRIRVGNTVT
jgi:predicted nucleic acid-binding protein